ncbi:MAG: bifunctional folylpolyglutamate synthase/dihydrofolate synthase [Chitinispirillaceae bacterium]
MESAERIRTRLFSLVNNGIKYELGRMKKASEACGNPHESYPSVHIAGTNGKGSTCTLMESVLRRSGFKTGLYTSPHITNFEERFRVNGEPVDEQVWLEVYRQQETAIRDYNLTFFEAATLMAFEIFRRAGVQYAVFETGMGGRLDATNIITPEVSVITRIAMDHKEFLGDTLEKIAREKLGIVKGGVPVVMADPGDELIRDMASNHCRDQGAELKFVSDRDACDIRTDSIGTGFVWKTDRYTLPFFGRHQVTNALLALNALKCTGNFPPEVLFEGLRNASLEGRFQIVELQGKTVIFDVGHNSDAASALVEALHARFSSQKVLFVVGVMKDKDVGSVLRILSRKACGFVFAKPQTPRAADPQTLCEQTRSFFGGECIAATCVASALKTALESESPVMCVTGSFYTVGEAKKAITN